MFKTTITPRVSETDGVGHVNNTFLPVWFEAGRHELFGLFNPDYSFDDWRMVIVKTTVTYKEQVYFGENVIIKCWVKKIGGSSLELYEEAWQGSRLCATNEAIYVNYNMGRKKAEQIPDEIREQLEKYYYEGGDSDGR